MAAGRPPLAHCQLGLQAEIGTDYKCGVGFEAGRCYLAKNYRDFQARGGFLKRPAGQRRSGC